jgi:hypothetical protein
MGGVGAQGDPCTATIFGFRECAAKNFGKLFNVSAIIANISQLFVLAVSLKTSRMLHQIFAQYQYCFLKGFDTCASLIFLIVNPPLIATHTA